MSSDSSQEPPSPYAGGSLAPRQVASAASLYALMALLSILWGWQQGRPNLLHHPTPAFTLSDSVGIAASLLAAITLTGITILGNAWFARFTKWGARLQREFRHLIGPLARSHVSLLAITSAVGEELLFRGAMQPVLGLWLTSALFGVLHGGLSRRLWPWAVWAGAMGLVLGAMYEALGTLIAPLLAHASINYASMRKLQSTYTRR
ncbi:MAG: CPBP family intramembrane metalloprotease [Proteobacteria bacterium]|nr:CPBP family intramembrane metalloprotease [Pseudomonadota bacterium]